MPSKRSISLIVGDPPGSSADSIARRLARYLTGELGQNVIVDNRAADGEDVAALSVAEAAPDGYTAYIASRSTVFHRALCDDPEYDFIRDFSPVAMITHVPYVLVTGKHIPSVTFREILEQDRRVQYGFTCASGPVGSTPQLILETLREQANLNWLDAPYDADSTSVAEVTSGSADFAILGAPSALPYLGPRGLRVLAVFLNGRPPFLPAVPSIAEFGFADAEAQGWFALVAPRRTPSHVVARLNYGVNKALVAVSVGKKLMQSGYMIPESKNTPETLKAFIEQDIDRWIKTPQPPKVAIAQ